MYTYEITHSVARLAHAIADLCAALDSADERFGMIVADDWAHTRLSEYRVALIAHANAVTELVELAQPVLGEGPDIRFVTELLDDLLERSRELRVAIASGDRIYIQLGLAFVETIAEELFDAESRLMSTAGTLLFPAETF